jgi:predicted nucleotidyltransferase
MDTVAAGGVLAAFRDEIRRIASRYGVGNIRVFGSAARGDGRPDSDVDFLVDLEPGRDLLDLIAAKQDLEDLLGRKVDIVTERSVSPYIRDFIMEDLVCL